MTPNLNLPFLTPPKLFTPLTPHLLQKVTPLGESYAPLEERDVASCALSGEGPLPWLVCLPSPPTSSLHSPPILFPHLLHSTPSLSPKWCTLLGELCPPHLENSKIIFLKIIYSSPLLWHVCNVPTLGHHHSAEVYDDQSSQMVL
jgi:hypothetical protein